MEWVWQVQNNILSSLHWNGPSDWSTSFDQQNMNTVATQWTTYGVEYSAATDDEYVQFYTRDHTGATTLGKKATPALWKDSWKPNPPCTASSTTSDHCTPLAPFDNRMTLIINLAVGGAWGGCCGVNSYAAFDKGVIMQVSDVSVYELTTLSPTLNPMDWVILKDYDLTSMTSIRKDWDIISWPAGFVNGELEAYVDNPDNLFVDKNGVFTIRAIKRANGCVMHENKDNWGANLKSVNGQPRTACCQLCRDTSGCGSFAWNDFQGGTCWLKNVYGDWPEEGEIDVMEWVWQQQNQFPSSLHWKGPSDWSTVYTELTMKQMATEWTVYGVEYSGVANDEYIQFYMVTEGGAKLLGTKVTPSLWKSSWNPTPSCKQTNVGGTYCSNLAPFDNYMNIIMNFAVGGAWGGCCGVNSYAAFEGTGVDFKIRNVTVYQHT